MYYVYIYIYIYTYIIEPDRARRRQSEPASQLARPTSGCAKLRSALQFGGPSSEP